MKPLQPLAQFEPAMSAADFCGDNSGATNYEAAFTEARNMRRIDQALTELSKRVGFRVTSGLSERVIYRELFPSGLTLLDKGHLGELGTSHLVARQELRSLIASLGLPMPGGRTPELALAASA